MLSRTYGDLKQSVQKFLNRNDPEVISMIPEFITLAEQEFARLVKIPLDEAYTEWLYDANLSFDDFIPIPDDCLSPIGFLGGNVNKLDKFGKPIFTSYTRVDGFALFEYLKCGTDKGHYFAKYNNQWRVYPEMVEGDVFAITYHRDLVPMANDSDTSPALKYGYDLMLYWALKHATNFARDDAREAVWTQKATEALETMQTTFEEQHWGGSPLIVKGIY